MTVRQRIIDAIVTAVEAITSPDDPAVEVHAVIRPGARFEDAQNLINAAFADGKAAIELLVGHDESEEQTSNLEHLSLEVGLVIHLPPTAIDEHGGDAVASAMDAEIYKLYAAAGVQPGRWTDADGDPARSTIKLAGGGVYFDPAYQTTCTEHAMRIQFAHVAGDPDVAA